jgi:hypothetical protein
VFSVVLQFFRQFGKQIINLLIFLLSEDQGDVYHYVVLSEYNILHPVKDIVHNLKKFNFIKTLMPMRRSYQNSKMFYGLVPEFLYKADSLFVAIAPRRAVLYQNEPQPFTSHDLALREIILSLYPRNSLVGLFSKEPSFDIQTTPLHKRVN